MSNPGRKTTRSLKSTERWLTRKKEKINEQEIKTMSQQKIIQRGAKFFKKLLDIVVNLIFGRRVKH
jgi:hypothetical protein